jgi:hypothetical protein
MHQSLPSLLFPEYRRRVLGLLLLQPDAALHGREIARRTGLPSGTITRELGKLARGGTAEAREARQPAGVQRGYQRPDLRGAGQYPAQDIGHDLRAGSGVGAVGAEAACGFRLRIGGAGA